MFTGRKLPITLAFAVLLGLAFGASCKGFFVDPVLQSIAIDPTSPQVNVGSTITLRVFGTYDDGSRKQVKTGVSWKSETTDVATIDANTGVLTGVAPGSSIIDASAQALPASATASVILVGAALAVTPTATSVHADGSSVTFTFTGTVGTKSVDITTDNGGTLTITPSSTTLTCAPVAGTEVCTADTGTALGQYSITMTYPSATNSATATLTVTQ